MSAVSTSCRSGAIRAAVFDELEKIADEQMKRDSRWKRVAKAGAGYAVGAAAGTGAGMLLDKAVTHAFRHKYPHWSREKKLRFLGPLLGFATVAGMAAQRYAHAKQQKAYQDG